MSLSLCSLWVAQDPGEGTWESSEATRAVAGRDEIDMDDQWGREGKGGEEGRVRRRADTSPGRGSERPLLPLPRCQEDKHHHGTCNQQRRDGS
jgi:hypothetical protein